MSRSVIQVTGYQWFWETYCTHLPQFLPWRWRQQVLPKHWYLPTTTAIHPRRQ